MVDQVLKAGKDSRAFRVIVEERWAGMVMGIGGLLLGRLKDTGFWAVDGDMMLGEGGRWEVIEMDEKRRDAAWLDPWIWCSLRVKASAKQRRR